MERKKAQRSLLSIGSKGDTPAFNCVRILLAILLTHSESVYTMGLRALPTAYATDSNSARKMVWQKPGRTPCQQVSKVPDGRA